MTRPLLAGSVLAALAAVLVLLSGVLGPETQAVALLGTALGGALGLVPDRPPAQRAGAFAAGLAAAWVGYALRAAVLPDAPSGRAVAVLLVVLACTLLAAGTRGALPLWATLLGAAALAGAYEAAYSADPSGVVATSPAAATTVLLAAGAGFVATALLDALSGGRERAASAPPEPHPDAPTRADDDVAHGHAAPQWSAPRPLQHTQES
ncbi:hypothetical protein [Cellulomonas sp. NS3]|uniref:hypothetical protein n=1 Tax=Cellulomonas sp. NS3 TaxID=2973977 RepID=UPI002161FA00|nr:hypothetical protein [Cellulomonas sp. NS3]